MANDVSPEIDSVQAVIRGSFNPAILHPQWLALRGLIKEQDAADAEVKIVSREVTQFEVDWFMLQATGDYFSCESSDPSHFLALKDLVEGVFAFLEHTPVTRLGINRRMHFKVGSEDRWHELGDRWAPKDPWKDYLTSKKPDRLPGLRSLTMEGERQDSTAEYLRVKVEPSLRLQPGIYIETNEHHELAVKDESPMSVMRKALTSDWVPAQDFALAMARHLLSNGAK